MDDLIDVFSTAFDVVGSASPADAAEAGRAAVRRAVEGKYVGKLAAPLEYGPRAVNYIVDRVGVDQDQTVRRFLTVDPASLERNPGIGFAQLPGAADTATGGAVGSDAPGVASNPDAMLTGQMDP